MDYEKRYRLGGLYLTALISFFYFISGSTRFFSAHFPRLALSSRGELLTFLTSLLFFIAALFLTFSGKKVQKKPANSTSIEKFLGRHRLHLIFVFGALTLVQLAVHISGPLTFDELTTGTILATNKYSKVVAAMERGRIDSVTMIHPVSVTSNYVITQLFGVSPLTLRIGSVLMAALFLAILGRAAFLWFSPVTVLLLFGNLPFNGLFIQLGTSARGYAGMLLSTLIVFLTALRATQAEPKARTRFLWPLLVFGTFACLTTLHGFLFTQLLFASLLIWLGRESFRNMKWFVLLPLLTLPLGMLYYPLLTFGDAKASVFQAASEHSALWGLVGGILGQSRNWWSKPALGLIVGLIAFRTISRKKLPADFLSLFLGLSIALTLLTFYFKSGGWEARYFIVFLVPLLMWISALLEQVTSPKLRQAAFALAAVLIVLIPLLSFSQSYRNYTGNSSHLHLFAVQVKNALPPGKIPCVVSSAENREGTFLQKIYFPDSSKCDGEFWIEHAYRLPAKVETRVRARVGEWILYYKGRAP